MKWADAVPNLLIGLREGLEAGLVVSILLAALRKMNSAGGQRLSSAPLWLGVLGAVTVAGSFAAVLTFGTNALSSRAQEAVGGLLSVLAVGLVTGMIFWMRRTPRPLSAQPRGDVARAVAVGAGALTVTAFLAVGRDGLETTLFISTAVKASGSTVAPLAGAGLGLAAAQPTGTAGACSPDGPGRRELLPGEQIFSCASGASAWVHSSGCEPVSSSSTTWTAASSAVAPPPSAPTSWATSSSRVTR